jgi:hypothetical protein
MTVDAMRNHFAPREPATPGFAIQILPDTELGLAMLIAEDEEAEYQEPVAVCATINEAKEVAAADFRSRMKSLEAGEEPGICPYEYKLWARGLEGRYRIAATFNASEL